MSNSLRGLKSPMTLPHQAERVVVEIVQNIPAPPSPVPGRYQGGIAWIWIRILVSKVFFLMLPDHKALGPP